MASSRTRKRKQQRTAAKHRRAHPPRTNGVGLITPRWLMDQALQGLKGNMTMLHRLDRTFDQK